MTAYPGYFTGDIREPKDKLIFIGINPGFNEKENRKEQAFLRNRGSYEGYCRIFADFFGQGEKRGFIPYYGNIATFLELYFKIKRPNWDWFLDNLIALD